MSVTIETKRRMISDLAAKLYASGMSGDEAAALAWATIQASEEEWNAMTPAQQAARYVEAKTRLDSGFWK